MGACIDIINDATSEFRDDQRPNQYARNPNSSPGYAPNRGKTRSGAPAYAQNPYAAGGGGGGQTQSLKCAQCQNTLGVPPGCQCVTCPKCGMANGVPYTPTGYHQEVGQHQAAIIDQPPPEPTGRKRGLLVGCNYPGTQAELSGCINDVRRITQMLVGMYSFDPSCLRILTDDGRNAGMPTRQNMIQGIRWLVEGAQPGDVLFFHFSGHGGQEEDPTYTEEDGYDETLCPTDFQIAGQIVDSELFDILCAPLPSGVKITVILDCCHSGTGLDLPFTWTGGRWAEEDNPCFCAADVQMISGCEDAQCSADASDRFGAPAGALTSALCDTLEQCPMQPYPQLLSSMYANLQRNGHTQRPQLTSSQAFDINAKQFNPCGDITSNMNPALGRQFRKSKHPRRDFGDSFGDMLGFGGGGMLMGAILPNVLDLGGYGVGQGFDVFGDAGGGMMDMAGGAGGLMAWGGAEDDGEDMEPDGGGGGGGGGFLDGLGAMFGGGGEDEEGEEDW
eukprot:CAMPEP_0168407536 /NCGR_PEP_ID=MMETSP0228-20121227/26211_1 /TAXON_ID=133427 /ORGANISM="Protoceratium reticulatum, Strain CCCM 535 (=CCMP 1889)" /LENGTH=502 /DNA_ID=CAMNT_0008421205 /DNA_START=88 /DNA_END=1596 /DNA_ORIENTATION=-